MPPLAMYFARAAWLALSLFSAENIEAKSDCEGVGDRRGEGEGARSLSES